MLRFCLLVLMLLPSVAMADDVKVEGRWNTANGPLTISRADTGEYTLVFDKFPGKVAGTLSGEAMNGEWRDVVKSQPCATEKDGSPYWGTFSINFYGPPAIAKPAFQGILALCEKADEGFNFSGELSE